jgi:hypothetical protein
MLETIKALTAMVDMARSLRPVRQILVEYFDGARPAGSPIEGTLRSLGFYRERNQTMRYDALWS